MFILNKKGTNLVYKNVLQYGCIVRIVDDVWQIVYKDEISKLDIGILLKGKLGSIPPK